MEYLKIDRSKLYTQTEYAKKIGLSKARVNQKIKAGEIKVIKIKGATLVYED